MTESVYTVLAHIRFNVPTKIELYSTEFRLQSDKTTMKTLLLLFVTSLLIASSEASLEELLVEIIDFLFGEWKEDYVGTKKELLHRDFKKYPAEPWEQRPLTLEEMMRE